MVVCSTLATKNQQDKPFRFNKRIGSTNYNIAVYLSKTSRETMNDKIIRLIKNDIAARR